jgi:RNA-binding protein YhbY
MVVKFQLGKKGLTPEFVETLRKSFKRHENVKISLLKSYSRDREQILKDAEKICGELKDDFEYKFKLIGFTLSILKRKCKKPYMI